MYFFLFVCFLCWFFFGWRVGGVVLKACTIHRNIDAFDCLAFLFCISVKAAGVVCILSLGVGLGTLLIHRLYQQYIRPFLYKDQDGSDKASSSDQKILVVSMQNLMFQKYMMHAIIMKVANIMFKERLSLLKTCW